MNINFNTNNNGYTSINTNSKQYKAAAKDFLADHRAAVAAMTPEQRMMYELFGGEEAYMKNVMRNYDSDGNLLNAYGVAGMDATGKSLSEMHQIIDVSEEYRQKMFDECKRHFIQEYGVANGDTTKRTEVFTAYQKSVPIKDRLKGTWTLGQYEKNYMLAFGEAVFFNMEGASGLPDRLNQFRQMPQNIFICFYLLNHYICSIIMQKAKAYNLTEKKVTAMKKAEYISDEMVVKRVNAAVKIELEKNKALGIPAVLYDRENQVIYRENEDGTRTEVGKKIRKGRYSERVSQKT